MNSVADTERQAAQWLVRRDAAGWSSTDQAAFDEWMEQSTTNRIAVIRLQTVWDKAGRLRASDLNAPIVAGQAIEPALPPEEVAQEPRRRWLWPTALAASLALVAIPAYQKFVAPDHYSTAVGGYQQLPLADGSRVDLNTASRVAVKYSNAERHIRLARGEAYFKVAKDRSRPFVVEAAGYRIVAVGTAFTVRLRGADVEVMVSEGRVRIDGPARAGAVPRPLFVTAGEEILAASAGATVKPVSDDELNAAMSWREGLLVFEGKSLGEVAAEFNRYNNTQLVIDPSAARVTVDGAFRADNVDGFLRLLQKGFGVSSDHSRPGEIVLKKI